MKYLITGGSGLVGSKLISELLEDGHHIINLSRGKRQSDRDGLEEVTWDGKSIPESVGQVDVVLNLAGASVGKRWTDAYKKTIMDSRVWSTRACVNYINSQEPKPKVFISASGINYYGDLHTKPKSEDDPVGDTFLADVCKAWEVEAEKSTIRTVMMRISPVLDTEGGPLEKLLTPYKMFVGGPTGEGSQGFAWIHLDDMVRAIRFFTGHPKTEGPYNLAAPDMITNKQFANTLGGALNRPSFFRLPKFVLKTIFGEMSTVLWGGLFIKSDKIREAGFEFKFPTINEALTDLLK